MDMPDVPRRVGAFFGVLLLAATPLAEAAVGRTQGIASVSDGGEAQYSIPLALPPGTNGMTPALSLDYRHRSQGGLLGVGWSIGGLSQITRCPRTVAQDGIAARPQYSVADRFCLDGQRLVLVSGSVAEGSSPLLSVSAAAAFDPSRALGFGARLSPATVLRHVFRS